MSIFGDIERDGRSIKDVTLRYSLPSEKILIHAYPDRSSGEHYAPFEVALDEDIKDEIMALLYKQNIDGITKKGDVWESNNK